MSDWNIRDLGRGEFSFSLCLDDGRDISGNATDYALLVRLYRGSSVIASFNVFGDYRGHLVSWLQYAKEVLLGKPDGVE